MKKSFIATMAILSVACSPKERSSGPLEINNALTQSELASGVLSPEVMWKMGRVGSFALSPDGATVVFDRTDYNVAENRGVTTLWTIPTAGGEAAMITSREGNSSGAVWSADGQKIYFLSDRGGKSQVWSADKNGGAQTQITNSEIDVEHFGVAGGRIFLTKRTKVDKRTTSEIYEDLPQSKGRVYDELMVRHWDRWTDGSHMHIFVADFDGAAVTNEKDIMAGEPYDAPMEPYFDGAEIAWNNAGTQLAYTCKKMGDTEYAASTNSDIYIYDAAAGTTTNICTPQMVGYDKYPVWSPDDSKIAIRSMARAGFEADKQRLLIYDTTSKTFTDLTAGFDFSAENVVWTSPAELQFTAAYLGTHQLFSVDGAGVVTQLTYGMHDVTGFSTASGQTVVSMTRQDRAAELYTFTSAPSAPAPTIAATMVEPSNLVQLTKVNDAIFGAIRTGRMEPRIVRTTDGRDMLAWVTYPPDFDPAKKYPALLYCEGGPQSAVSQFWSYRWNFQLMAARGYIVVSPNRRGTLGFGQQWTDEISGDYSGQNIRDLLAAIDDVAKEPFVDKERLGCVGASYGGYSSFYLAGVHQGRFKAFISHCGIFNFESMYGQTEELFFVNHDYGGPFWIDSEVARKSYANSPHHLVKNWDTPILIITGLNDFRIPYAQSLEAHTAARVQGVPSRLVAFENEAHQVFKPQNNVAWNREFFGWLDKYLKK